MCVDPPSGRLVSIWIFINGAEDVRTIQYLIHDIVLLLAYGSILMSLKYLLRKYFNVIKILPVFSSGRLVSSWILIKVPNS